MADILLVEDDPDTRDLVRLHLESAEHVVRIASNGAEGLELALSQPPDLIVSDIMMPVVNGLEMLKSLREHPATLTIPVIFLTAAGERAVFRESMRLGADDYLDKPVRRDELLDSIGARLRRIRAIRESAGGRPGTPTSGAQANGEQPVEIAGYRVLRLIGQGGMSRVYLAEHLETGAQRVLKVVPISDSDEGEMLQRFIHEFALVSAIDHPNVARIYDQGFSEQYAYIAMEYFPGGDLRAMIGNGMAPEVALAVLVQVAGGLGAIHQQGVVHRDMKPDNVMVRSDGTLAIADFGIAKKPSAQLSETQHGEIFGTPYYLSPEQATTGNVDARSDIYSLGVMFYEMLTGQKPYRAADIEGLLAQHVSAPVPRLPAQLSRLQPLLESMMAKGPAQRFSSAEEVVAACLELEESQD